MPVETSRPVRIGVIADTHGTLDSRVFDLFQGVVAVIHAGDIGSMEILVDLESIAPVYAVRGNTDHLWPSRPLRWQEDIAVGGLTITVVHDRLALDVHGDSASRVLVSGHTHVPEIMWLGSQLFVNPGSASRPRTADDRATIALLDLAQTPTARIVALDSAPVA